MKILSTRFGKSMIFTVFAMAKVPCEQRPFEGPLLAGYGQRRNILIENLYDHNFPSKKYYRRPDI